MRMDGLAPVPLLPSLQEAKSGRAGLRLREGVPLPRVPFPVLPQSQRRE